MAHEWSGVRNFRSTASPEHLAFRCNNLTENSPIVVSCVFELLDGTL